MSDALRRSQNANDAPPPDAQNVTGTRKSCEVPSCPSFPQVPKERPASSVIEGLVVRASAERSLLAPWELCKRGRKSQTAPAYSGAALLFALRPSKQSRRGAKDCGEYRQSAGAVAAIKRGFLLFGRIAVRVHNALNRVIASRADKESLLVTTTVIRMRTTSRQARPLAAIRSV